VGRNRPESRCLVLAVLWLLRMPCGIPTRWLGFDVALVGDAGHAK